MSGATLNYLPTHKLFGFRYIIFSAANIHFCFEFTKKEQFLATDVFNAKNMPKSSEMGFWLHGDDFIVRSRSLIDKLNSLIYLFFGLILPSSLTALSFSKAFSEPRCIERMTLSPIREKLKHLVVWPNKSSSRKAPCWFSTTHSQHHFLGNNIQWLTIGADPIDIIRDDSHQCYCLSSFSHLYSFTNLIVSETLSFIKWM